MKKTPPHAGIGRPKGSLNKTTALLKDAILAAAEGAGGGPPNGMRKYLQDQALAYPGPFMTLLGKVLPLQVTGEGGGPVQFQTIYEAVRTEASAGRALEHKGDVVTKRIIDAMHADDPDGGPYGA